MLATLLLLGAVTASAPAVAPVSTGAAAIGDELHRSRGAPTLVFVWASWCAACKAKLPAFEALLEDAPGLKVVAVSIDRNPYAMALYLKAHPPKFKPWRVSRGDLGRELGRRGLSYRGAIPYVALLDASGKVITQGLLDAAEVAAQLPREARAVSGGRKLEVGRSAAGAAAGGRP